MPLKFLIIDDDEYKINQVREILKEHQVEVANSYVSAMNRIIRNEYDGIILDMCFPLYDGEFDTLEKDQGISVLEEMKRKHISYPVAVYSGDKKDVSEFDNVLKYIINGNYDIRQPLQEFVSNLKK